LAMARKGWGGVKTRESQGEGKNISRKGFPDLRRTPHKKKRGDREPEMTGRLNSWLWRC